MSNTPRKPKRDKLHESGVQALTRYAGPRCACSMCVYAMNESTGYRARLPLAQYVVPTGRGDRQLCASHAMTYVVPS